MSNDSHSATRFVCLCEPDDRLACWHDRVLIVSPRNVPMFLNLDGSRTPIILASGIHARLPVSVPY